MFSQAQYEARSAEAKAIAKSLSDAGVQFVEMQLPDINGTMRGKIATLGKGLSAAGTGVSTLIMSARGGDNLTIDFWSDFDNGFPKIVGLPDYATVAQCPWRPDVAQVLCDFYMEDGSPCPLDARIILKRVLAEYEAIGLEPRAALEWEFYLYEADDDLLRQRRYADLRTFGRGWDFYSVTRFPTWEPLAKEFMRRLAGVGIDVEAFHTEYGNGMYEFTCGHEHALKAADDAVRAKAYLRQLADEHGLVPTFIPAIHVGSADSHNGCHHNLSLWRDGKNATWDEGRGDISDVGRHFAAGILSTMSELHLVLRPWVTSHRRMDRLSWAPEDASWGPDNHAVALRVIHGSVPARSARFEHRAPGPDINPYLSLAAMLWGGLLGIRNRLEPPAYAVGDPILHNDFERLPKTLPASIEAFRASAVAQELLGAPFVDHLVALKQEEWESFAAWAAEHDVDPSPEGPVTDWELDQYFVWV